jgi:phosphatidylserine/phosphatidylglycerophosphate/cardiolipin synthase-like enzyme
MILDDAMFTLGSANLNFRSMHTDSEINIATDDFKLATDLRQRVWTLHSTANRQDLDRIPIAFKGKITAPSLTGGDGSQAAITLAFDNWSKIAQQNLINKKTGKPLVGYIVQFRDKRTSNFRLA